MRDFADGVLPTLKHISASMQPWPFNLVLVSDSNQPQSGLFLASHTGKGHANTIKPSTDGMRISSSGVTSGNVRFCMSRKGGQEEVGMCKGCRTEWAMHFSLPWHEWAEKTVLLPCRASLNFLASLDRQWSVDRVESLLMGGCGYRATNASTIVKFAG